MNGFQTPRLSIVIPCLSAGEQFENTLASVLQNRPDDCELIVVQCCSYEDPYDLHEEVRFLALSAQSTIVECINAGMEAARGEYVHILQCGLQVTDGWAEAAIIEFEDPRVGAVSPLIVDGSGSSGVVTSGVGVDVIGRRIQCSDIPQAGRANAPSRTHYGPSLLAAFYRRSVVQRCGGFDTVIDPGCADLDLALSLAAIDVKCCFAPKSRIQSSLSDFSASNLDQRPYTAGWSAQQIVWRHASTLGWGQVLLAHPRAVIGELFDGKGATVSAARLIGRLVACCQIRSCRRYFRRLRAVRSQQPPDRSSGTGTSRIDPPHRPGAAEKRASGHKVA